jgi:NADH dehydrogenase [ubiquinone] 1 alpha subcomplex assembly factor 2
VSPAWHQWLRHTREQPPSIQEQQGDVVRQAQLKVLAAQADARWEAKARLVGQPAADEGVKQIDGKVWGAAQPVTGPGETGREQSITQEQPTAKQRDDDPWKKAKGGPSEQWQPQAWSPRGAPKR